MTTTAQTREQQLETYRCRFVTLGFLIKQEQRRFHYPATLIEQQTSVHNEIIQLRMTPMKEVSIQT